MALFAAALVASGFATLPMAIAHAETSGSQMVIVPADAAPEITEVADLVLEVSPMVLAIGNLDGSLIAEGGKRFRLDANVLFRFDSADLTGPADAVLDDLVSQLKAGGAKSLRVDGYTDQVGTRHTTSGSPSPAREPSRTGWSVPSARRCASRPAVTARRIRWPTMPPRPGRPATAESP